MSYPNPLTSSCCRCCVFRSLPMGIFVMYVLLISTSLVCSLSYLLSNSEYVVDQRESNHGYCY